MKRLAVRLAVTSLVAAVLPTLPIAATPAQAAVADGVGYTLEGCRYDGVGDPYAGHPFTCDNSAYTTGNLGKGWAELDLVPHRITVTANTVGTVDLIVAGDALKDSGGNVIGWDYISAPVLNASLSSSTGCSAPTFVAPYDPNAPAKKFGGADTSTYRAFTLDIQTTSNKGCVYDYYQRLSVGSGGYPGSSLQSYVDGPSGQKRVSIPVPTRKQTFDKTMTATRDASFGWALTKSASGLTLGDTCATSTGSSGTATVTITWTKTAIAGGNALVTATFKAFNPASRTIELRLVDRTWEGTTAPGTVLVDTSPTLTQSLTAGETKEWTYSFQTASQAASFADEVSVTYHDPIVGDDVATITDTATAAVATGATNDGTASIVDVETLNVLTGSGLTYSSNLPSGSFDAPYVAGTPTTGSITWRSGTLSSSGSVTFTKTVYAARGSAATATLDDTATLTKGTSGTTITRTASIGITSGGVASITVTKTAPNFYQGSDTSSFVIHLATGTTYNAANDVGQHTFAFSSSTPVVNGRATLSYTFTGLTPGASYVLHEDPTAGWGPNSDVVVNLTGTNVCSSGAQFDNNPGPASAQARKVTIPAGSEAGWELILTGPGTPVGGEKVTTTGTGYRVFSTVLQEGSYTITETPKTGWDQTGSSSECSFTVNYPADNDRVFSCTITNTQRGHIVVYKHTDPAADPQGFTFTPSYNGGATFVLHDGENNDSGALVPGSYSVSETMPTGWLADPNRATTCSDGATSYAPSAITLAAGKTVTCHFYNTKKGHVRVLKTFNGATLSGTDSFTFQLRSGATSSAAGSVLETQTTNAGNVGDVTFSTYLTPGATYQLCETGVPVNWHTTLSDMAGAFSPGPAPVDNSTVCVPFTVNPGETKTFTVNNTRPGGDARTIGYWKNWSSCKTSGGKQAPILDRTLAKSEPNGISVGTLVLHGDVNNPNVAPGCGAAVRLLNKSRVDTGAKSASDPVFNFAAQYVAAQLNYVAGAQQCPAATSAMSSGQALLVTLHFNGSTHDALTSSQKTQLNQWAGTLDQYNNNNLC